MTCKRAIARAFLDGLFWRWRLTKLKMSGFLSKPKQKLWSDESMAAAVRSVREGMGLRESARLYNVPIETLRRRVIGSVDLGCKSGPPTVLTKDEEDMLARYLVEMADMGFELSPEDVRYTAFRIAEASGRPHPFQSGIAGYAWMDGFRAWHPRLAVRTAQSLSRSRAACANEDTISDYFAKLGAVYARLNILSKPMQIYNVDETGISIVHKPGKVVTEIWCKNVWSLTSAEKGDTYRFDLCVCIWPCPPSFHDLPKEKDVRDPKGGSCSWYKFSLQWQWLDNAGTVP